MEVAINPLGNGEAIASLPMVIGIRQILARWMETPWLKLVQLPQYLQRWYWQAW